MGYIEVQYPVTPSRVASAAAGHPVLHQQLLRQSPRLQRQAHERDAEQVRTFPEEELALAIQVSWHGDYQLDQPAGLWRGDRQEEEGEEKEGGEWAEGGGGGGAGAAGGCRSRRIVPRTPSLVSFNVLH